MAFVQAICLAYTQRGLSPEAALAKAQIPAQAVTDPEARITANQMEWLSEAAMRELDDEALGWFGRRLPWGSYGMLARASVGAPHLERALKRWCRHHALLTDDLHLTLTQSGGLATLAIEERRDLGPLREFCLVSMLRNAHGLACWWVASRLPLVRSSFPYSPPAHADVYPVLFPGGPVGFAAERAALVFDARYLALPVRRDEAATNQMLQRALALTVRQYHRDRLLVARVEHLLQHNPEASHNADDLAQALNMSARTLHRQLQEEGATLQGLKDQVRRRVAQTALLRTRRPVKQVAAAAGFQNEKAFARAFKAWTGLTPHAYRSTGQLPPDPLDPLHQG
jgi:AraC-like DNA-binding protein